MRLNKANTVWSRFLAGLLCLVLLGMSAGAEEAYPSYTYDSWGNSGRAPGGYAVRQVLNGATVEGLDLLEPSDFYVRGNSLYILDAGHGGIVELDREYRLIKTMRQFRTPEGEPLELREPSGIFVTANGHIAVADTGNGRVLLMDGEGGVTAVLTRPDSSLFPDDLVFAPKKVVIDDLGNVYVLSKGFYYGAVVYDAQGNFRRFFGANPVEVSVAQMMDKLWKKLLSKTQADYMAKYVPIEYSSMDIDEKGFLYTSTMNTETSLDELKKLNSLGANVLSRQSGYDPLVKNDYGDREKLVVNWQTTDTQFGDICVSEGGFINALDETRGRVFQYDRDSNLLTVFGGLGEQEGLFRKPVAVDTLEEDVLVLDKGKNSLTVFKPTAYGSKLRQATRLNNADTFSDDTAIWEDLLRMDAGSELACRGMGRAYLQNGAYEQAMDSFRAGQDRAGYSRAFQLYRAQVARRIFPVAAVGCVGLIVFLLLRKKLVVRLRVALHRPVREKAFRLTEIFTHPLVFYEKLFQNPGKTPLLLSLVLMVLFVLAKTLERQGTGFPFNQNNLDDFNIFLIAAQSVGLILLWCVADKVVGSLRFGEGTFRKIWLGGAFAMTPYILSVFITTFLSNFLTLEEQPLLTLITAAALLYSGWLLFTSVRTMQQYSVGQAAVSVVFDTAVAALILFLLVLLYSLGSQLLTFFTTIYSELMVRF